MTHIAGLSFVPADVYTHLSNKVLNVTNELSKFADAILSNVSIRPLDSFLKLKDILVRPTALSLKIRELSMNGVNDVNDISTLVNALHSNEFQILSCDLAKIMDKLEGETLKDMVNKAFAKCKDVQLKDESSNDNDVKQNSKDVQQIVTRLKSLLTLQKIEAVIGFSPVEEAIRVSKFVEGEYTAINEEKKQTYLRMAKIYISSMIEWVIENFKMAFALNDIGGEVDDPSLASMRVMMVLSLWGSLNAWLLSLSTMLGSATMTAAVVSCGLLVTTIGLAIYNSFLKPIPENCRPFDNYSSAEALGEWSGSIATLNSKVQEVIDALCANTESTWLMPLLIGPPGTGKSTIVRGVANRINSGNVPDKLKNAKVFASNTSNLSPENTIKKGKTTMDPLAKFTNTMRSFKRKVVVFLDEIHTAAMNGSTLIENIKTFITPGPSGFPYCIGATTLAEYRTYLAKNPAFVRRVKLIPVEPTDRNTTILILETMALQEADDLDVKENVFEKVYDLCAKHFPNMAQPSIAMNILAKAFSEARNCKNKDLEQELQLKQNAKTSLMHAFQRSLNIDTRTTKASNQVDQMDKLDSEISELERVIKEDKDNYTYSTNLKKQINALKKELYGMAIKIKQGQASDNFSKEFAIKQNFLQPALNKIINPLLSAYSPGVVDKDLIEKIIFKEVEDRRKSKKEADPELKKAYERGRAIMVDLSKKLVGKDPKKEHLNRLFLMELPMRILKEKIKEEESE